MPAARPSGSALLVRVGWVERVLTVEFGPSRSKRFHKAVEEAQSGAGECGELEPGRYRVRFVLGSDGSVYTSLARLLQRVRDWRATINPLLRTSHHIAGSTEVRRRCCAPRGRRAHPSESAEVWLIWSRGSARHRSDHSLAIPKRWSCSRTPQTPRRPWPTWKSARRRATSRPRTASQRRQEPRRRLLEALRGANGSASRSRGLSPRWLGSAGWSGC